MSIGLNADPTPLWHGNYKINAPGVGFNFKIHIAEKSEADALTAANDIATRIKKILPTSCEIFYATISKDNSKKDSRFLLSALGAGEFVIAPATESDYDHARTALLFRMEHGDGSSITRKHCPLPDAVVTAGITTASITPITSTPVAAPAASAVADGYASCFNKFMGALAFYTHHVQSGHQPGGQYSYFPWTAAYVLRTGVKKGGPVLAE